MQQNSQEVSQNPQGIETQTINWAEILNESYPKRQFPIRNNPDEVEGSVNEAVFKTLTGRKIKDEQRRSLTQDLEDENDAINTDIIIMSARNMLEAKGFVDEKEEAAKQALNARTALDGKPIRRGDTAWNTSYDYWKLGQKIGEGLWLERPHHGSDDLLILTAPVSTINGKEGFPTTLFAKSWDVYLEDIQANPNRKPGSEMEDIVGKLGYSEDEYALSFDDNARSSLLGAVVDHDQIEEYVNQYDPNGKDYLKRLLLPYKKEFFDFVYENLTEEQKQKMQEGIETNFSFRRERHVNQDNQVVAEERLDADVYDIHVGYNQDKKKVDFDINKGRGYRIHYEVIPIVDFDTTHQDLLKVRNDSINKAASAGM